MGRVPEYYGTSLADMKFADVVKRFHDNSNWSGPREVGKNTSGLGEPKHSNLYRSSGFEDHTAVTNPTLD